MLRLDLRTLGGAALGVVLLIGAAAANPTLGHLEDFTDGTVGAWQGGSAPVNPGSGGVSGGTDGYMLLDNPALNHFGAFSNGPEYLGNWTTAGITQVRVWMNDVNTADNFQMHLALGTSTNFWERNAAIVPPNNQWAEFIIPLDGPTGWTRIIGTTGTFPQALANVQKIHFRHDLAPYSQTPDDKAGDLGIDRILLTNGTVGVNDGPAVSSLRAVQLAPPYPNPARGPVTISFTQYGAAPATVEIFDVTGRRVRAASLGEAGPGPRTWMWDGLDDGGHRVAAGAYRVRVTGPHGGETQPIVRIE